MLHAPSPETKPQPDHSAVVTPTVPGRILDPRLTEEEIPRSNQATLQKIQSGDASNASAPPIVDEVLRSAGQPLEAETRAFMEPRLGHDFDQVRVHTDAQAAESARAVNAVAYTVGQDVVFDSGKYSPTENAGRELLAHELAHVIQQAEVSGDQPVKTVAPASDSFEREANQVARSAVLGQPAQVAARTAAPALQRQTGEAEPLIVQNHPREISFSPTSGSINAAGNFTIDYTYNNVSGPGFASLTLSIPEGVAAGITPLSYISNSDYRITDPGGTGARAITIAASVDLTSPPRFQVTFTKGSFSYIVIFNFPSAPAPSPSPSPSPKP